jgi:Protein of unknown function (DUF3305)
MSAVPLVTIGVGVTVERVKASSSWIDHIWRPTSVLAGQPDTPAWTVLADDGERTTFYAGPATIELHRAEAANYRTNLASGSPALWVALKETGGEPPYALLAVTADPAEGEGFTEAGNHIVEPVPMPDPVREAVAAFVAEHHVEEAFVKRRRDRADPEALGRRPPARPRDER